MPKAAMPENLRILSERSSCEVFFPTVAVFGLFIASFGSANDEYQVIDGQLFVIGLTLETAESLPDLSCEECGSAHIVSMIPSPDERRVLVVSDVHLANFDAWIIERAENRPPLRIAAQRAGRHLTRSAWHGNGIVELTFAGTGYSTTLLYDVSRADAPREIRDCLLVDIDRDIYVRYAWDANSNSRVIEVGSVFDESGPVERFSIALDNRFHSDSLGMLKAVEAYGEKLFVTYETEARGVVQDVFRPSALAIRE